MKPMWRYAHSALLVSIASLAAAAPPGEHPGCDERTALQCIDLALDAMGGRERLLQLKGMQLQSIGHTLLAEQSYRQDPFITSYERDDTMLDLVNGRLRTEAKATWPESDQGQAESDATLIVGAEGGVYHSKDGDSPCGLGDVNAARQLLALGPARVLFTASQAADLRYAPAETLRGTAHTVVAFEWRGIPVRALLNPYNHLPDAVETTQQFQDMWYFWGDVHQRIYFDNFKLVQGISFPTNLVEERNGMVWSSTQALDLKFDAPADATQFAMDAAAAKRSSESHGWNRPFHAEKSTELAPGVDLYPGAWNSTIVKQSDGLLILEAPISGMYTKGVIDEARRRYPGAPIKAVLSSSDSWPHIGGVRFAVSQGLALYVLDLNRALLDRLVRAKHSLDADELSRMKQSIKPWNVIAGKTLMGSGANRVEIYPLRGASTERQYMVYFPEFRLLYASDTLALNEDGSLYDPELMHEVAQAVERENLKVDTVFAMHQGPTSWETVMAQVHKARKG
jgi:hypothetical protein